MVMIEQSYTSTPPMGHTACTEPQCLYKGALYPFFYPFHKIYCDKMCINTVLPTTFDILYDIFQTKLQYTFLVLQVCTPCHAFSNLPG